MNLVVTYANNYAIDIIATRVMKHLEVLARPKVWAYEHYNYPIQTVSFILGLVMTTCE